MSEWVDLYGAPFVTVSSTGLTQGQHPNNGANFGPDTPGTKTSGIQEALNSVSSSGGHVFCQRGAYSVSAAIYFTGSFQLLEFASGSSLTFSNGLTGVTPSWFDHSNYFNHVPALIHMGSPLTSSAPTPYSNQCLIGNGLQLNWGANTSPTLNNGVEILIPGVNSSSPYSGPSGQNYLVTGLVTSGEVSGQLLFSADNYQPSSYTALTYAQCPKNLRVTNFYATYSDDSNPTYLSAIYIRGGCHILLEDCSVDCSALPAAANADAFNIASDTGEVYNITVRRCYFKSSGVSGGNQCIEVQGNAKSGSYSGGTHDVIFEHCSFDSGSSSVQTAGSGGAYIDDTNGATVGAGQVWNVEFRQCRWINCGMQLQSALTGSQLGVGQTVGASPYTYVNNDGHSEAVTVSGGTVSAISVTPYGGSAIVTGATSGTYLLHPGDSMTVTYSGTPTMTKNPFGFLRFIGNMPNGSSAYPSGFNGSLAWRGPGSIGPNTVMPATGTVSYTNNDGFPETVVLSGGTVTGITMNGASTGVTAGSFDLWPGDTLAVTVTARPTAWVRAK